MVDYQHVVAIHADATQRMKGNWTEMLEPCLGVIFVFNDYIIINMRVTDFYYELYPKLIK